MTCVSREGDVLGSTFLGPAVEHGSLQLVASESPMRGRSNYSISVTKMGGVNGDQYQCAASNLVSSLTADFTLSGQVFHTYPKF